MRRNRKDLRLRNVHALAVARGAVEELEGVGGAVAAGEVARVLDVVVALRVGDRVVVVLAAKAEDAAVRVAVDGVKARAVIAKADAEMAEASSSRT
jgi:hypothetical protein